MGWGGVRFLGVVVKVGSFYGGGRSFGVWRSADGVGVCWAVCDVLGCVGLCDVLGGWC